jgi:uncharacterized alpha-E superfamily protein
MIREPQRLLSRVADSVYWMARYIERAENVARFISVNLHLQLDLPLTPAHQWQPLIDTSGDAEEFKKRHGEATQANVIQFLTADPTNPNSIFSCVRAARENARSVRETISSSMWEQVNNIYLQMQRQQAMLALEWLPETLRNIRLGCLLFQGITDATMSQTEAWRFLILGRMLERADKTSRILDVKYYILLPSPTAVGTPYDDLHWAAVLKSVGGFEMYRKTHGRIAPREIVDFLVMDRDFPRSIHHCINRADDCLHAVTGSPGGSYRYSSERLLGLLRAELDFTSVDHMIRDGLHEYLDLLQIKMNTIGESLQSDFFVSRPAVTALRPAPTQTQTAATGGGATPHGGR